jgi:Na+/H+-dicarboxylate symporter
MSGPGSKVILWGIVAGILLGALLGTLAPGAGVAVAFVGDLFLQMLKLLVVPLVVTSMIAGISGLGDVRHVGRTGLRTLLFYAATTFLAVALGLVLVNIIRPGDRFERPGVEGRAEVADRTLRQLHLERDPDLSRRVESGEVSKKEAIDALLERRRKSPGQAILGILEQMFPPNLFAALAETNVLALIVFSLVFGGILTTMGSRGEPVLRFFLGANEAIMGMVRLVMWVAPAGIFALVAGRIGAEGGGRAVLDIAAMLGSYAFTVLLGLAIHGLVVLPLLLRFLGRRSPLAYAGGMGRALLTAFSTASSSATLPLSIECTIRQNGVSERAANFVLPLGATVNMDGTALYEAVAVMFIAQAYGIHMGPVEMGVIFLTATLASIGAAGIPEAGLVTMVMVLAAVNLPLGGMGLILAIDWFLDRCRTTVNVWGDAVGAAVIDRFESPPVPPPAA